jgi:cation:H+ antiporter
LIIIGLVALIAGGKLVVNSAVFMATSMGVSEKLIGLTIIAAGTSLPELTTSVVAALKKNSDIAIGNVIGSNIFNIFFILGMSATVRPIIYDITFNRDIYLLLGGTALLFIFLYFGKKKLGRIPAGMLVATFILYTLYLISFEI